MFTFKLARHSVEPDRDIIEIWDGNTFVGAIYPTDQGIKLISKYIADNPEAAIKIKIDRSGLLPLPAILINIKKGD